MKLYIQSAVEGKYTKVQNEVVQKYNIILDEHSTCRMRTHAHVKQRRVCKWHPKNSIASTFELLHEIGHVETTKSWMRRCEQEYYATQWAIDRCKEYGLAIPDKLIQAYQEYIDWELEKGQRRHGSNYSTESLKLKV